VNIGKASWVKGTWETISILKNTNLSLAHIGGGKTEDINQLKEHAKSCNVEVWFAPRLTQNELIVLLRNARASISLAHGEPFGLTPIEAFAVGTPAIYVNEGGFRDTIIDKENGRLIAREDIDIWHAALKDAKNMEKRIRWSEAGKEKIKSLDLSCEKHAERIYNIYQELNNST
jgi:glycosyltransferase involved in cell wall biosynthesis